MPQRAQAITKPVLVVHGSEDSADPGRGQRAHGRLPRLRGCASQDLPGALPRGVQRARARPGARRRRVLDRGSDFESVRESPWLRCGFRCWRWSLAGCSSQARAARWVEDEVTFVADGLTIHGTYRHQHGRGAGSGGAADLGERSTPTATATTRWRARSATCASSPSTCPTTGSPACATTRSAPADRSRARTPANPADVGSAVYTAGARAALRFLAEQAGTDKDRISVYGLGEGTTHAMALATDTGRRRPEDPLAGPLATAARPLPRPDHRPGAQPTATPRSRRAPRPSSRPTSVVAAWTAAVAQARTNGTVPPGTAARRLERDPQPRQRQGGRRGRRRRPAGRRGQDPGRHPGAAHLFGFRRPGQLRRRSSRWPTRWRTRR